MTCIVLHLSLVLSPVEFEGEKDELEDVDGAEELELEGAVVPHAPYADRYRHHADEDLGEVEIMQRKLSRIRRKYLEYNRESFSSGVAP